MPSSLTCPEEAELLAVAAGEEASRRAAHAPGRLSSLPGAAGEVGSGHCHAETGFAWGPRVAPELPGHAVPGSEVAHSQPRLHD